ncbi:MAG: hypothetical protein R3C58_02125 [Parvularculaceae bacterium]
MSPVLFWPAAALILSGLALAIHADAATGRARFLLAWLLPTDRFELAGTKLPHYVLPLYPALAIMAAHAAMSAKPSRLMRPAPSSTAMVSLAAAAPIALPPLLFQQGAGSRSVSPRLGFAAISIFSLRSCSGAVAQGRRDRSLAPPPRCSLDVLGGVLPGLSDLAVSARLLDRARHRGTSPDHDHAGGRRHRQVQ